MRATIDLDDARRLARLQKQPLARTINQLLQRGLTREEPKIEIRKCIPVMVHGPGAIPITNELVGSLLDVNILLIPPTFTMRFALAGCCALGARLGQFAH